MAKKKYKKIKVGKSLLDIYKNLRERRQLQKVKERMKSIIKTTVGERVTLAQGNNWMYDTKKNTIYYVQDGPVVIGVMLHEIGHAKYSEPVSRDVFPTPEKEYGNMLNAVEDSRVEEKLMRRFPGTYDTFLEKVALTEVILDEQKVKVLPPYLNLLYNHFRTLWGASTIFKNKKVEEVFYRVQPILDEAITKNTTNEMERFLFDNAWKYISELIDPPKGGKNPDSDNKKNEDQNKQKQEGGGGGGGKGEEKQEEQDSKGGGNDNKEDERSEEEKQKDQERKNQEMEDKLENQVTDMSQVQDMVKDKEKEKKSTSMFDEVSNDMSDGETLRGIYDNDFKPSAPENLGFDRKKFKTYEELYADVAIHIPYFTKKINSIMTDNKLDRSGGEYRSGKLNTKKLYKWKCNNPKLFKRKVLRQHKDYSVYLLVDQSGSMFPEYKCANAARATVLMAEVLNKAGVDFAIRGFNRKHKVYKEFNQPYNWTVKRNLEHIIPSTNGDGSGGNNDGYNINKATYDLSKRTGDKILIVISDGQPNESSSSIPEEDSKRLKHNFSCYRDFELREEITKSKQTNTLIGVGIQAPYVVDYYPQAVLCNKIDELPNQLLNILRKNIKRG